MMQTPKMAVAMADSRMSSGRKGLTKAGMKAVLVSFLLALVLFILVANITPSMFDDINSTEFRDVPGGTLIADNATLILLIVLLAVVVVKFADLI